MDPSIKADNLICVKQDILQVQTITSSNICGVELINNVDVGEWAYSIAFNNDGSIIVVGGDKFIYLWKFEQGIMTEKRRLHGHTFSVYCLIFSKKQNLFISGSIDSTIRCWQEQADKHWSSTKPEQKHQNYILCLLMNCQEDEVISCGNDKAIVVWKLITNKLEYNYLLENKHNNDIYSLSLNQSETSLVSCGKDNKIILWYKWENKQWQFKNEIKMDCLSKRICFINEYQILWQEYITGNTHILNIDEGQFIQKSDISFIVNQEKEDGGGLFPIILNKKRQIIILKHNNYVYILKQQADGMLLLATESIDCKNNYSYGALTEDGQYLAIQNTLLGFRVYRIKYE